MLTSHSTQSVSYIYYIELAVAYIVEEIYILKENIFNSKLKKHTASLSSKFFILNDEG